MIPRSLSAPGLDATESPFSNSQRAASETRLRDAPWAAANATWRQQQEDTTAGTFHQNLQKSLSDRGSGGPREQVRSFPHRLRNTRACEILHSSMHDPLAPYKTLERSMPLLKRSQHRYHLLDGYKVFDNDTICLATRDQLIKTKSGLLRTSLGSATFSDTHRKKLRLDVQELVRILAHEGWPGGGHAWTPRKLERIFLERTGRIGCWAHYEVPFVEFLALFPKTFVFFNHREFIKLARTRNPTVLDEDMEAMVRIAMAREHGSVRTMHEVVDSNKKIFVVDEEDRAHTDLCQHRMKATFSHRREPVLEDLGEEGTDRVHGRYKREFKGVYQPSRTDVEDLGQSSSRNFASTTY